MFSGIRSMLFGYTEATNTNDGDGSREGNAGASSSQASESKISTDTSALLEQTLNAATTKFTEQLLPQSPSIEQLQSSSRQLLPTLKEQHEEDEYKKMQSKVNEDANVDNDDEDDDCFNDDSWELLDLNEKPMESTTGLDNSVQLVESVGVGSADGKISGILKQVNSTNGQATSKNDDNSSTRQKSKVSFETPDLVKEKKKIEQTIPKGKDPKNKKGKNKKAKLQNDKQQKSPKIAFAKNLQPFDDESGLSSKKLVEGTATKLADSNRITNHAHLNYAAALLQDKKLGIKSKQDDFNHKKEDVGSCSTQQSEVGIKTTGAMKRNRPVSTSSLSSFDETEPTKDDIDLTEDVFECPDNIDAESLASSGFSDCDYGYSCVNDYLMRPKKSQNKRRRQSSTSNSLINSMAKQGSDREKVVTSQEKQTNVKEQKNSSVKIGSEGKSVFSSKHTKPKKKRLVVESFLKPSSSSLVSDAIQVASSSNGMEQSSFELLLNSPNIFIQPETSDKVMSAPQTPSLANTSGNDSSDIAEMDESWFVTPPPCFTGSNKLDKAKSKEAARENALIEHPSIYIASTSQQKLGVIARNVRKQENKAKQPIKVSLDTSERKKEVASQSAKSESEFVEKKQRPSKGAKNEQIKKLSCNDLSSTNKFIVTNWNHDDEQDDIGDDFDNLFVSEISLSKKEKKSQRAKAKKATQLEVQQQTDLSFNEDDFGSQPNPEPVLEKSPEEIENIIDDGETIQLPEKTRPVCEKKAPTQVRPIEPERQPGWQLRKKRSKRRPLGALQAPHGGTSASSRPAKQQSVKNVCDNLRNSSEYFEMQENRASPSNSDRSSPISLIDRIGSSIVANLSNLTNGFPSTGSIQMQSRDAIDEAEKYNQTLIRRSNSEMTQVARRRLSKSQLDRQNICSRMANTNRRTDRRLKMHSIQNGCSVNRKVHTSFH